jgi:uncharacterized membrane protein YkoI
MTKSKLLNYFLPIVAVAAFAAGNASAYSGEELAKNAKVTMEQATEIAQKARPGTITDRELEKERGGSGLRYSFDIKASGHTYEVGVDAVTGKVLENGSEGKNLD